MTSNGVNRPSPSTYDDFKLLADVSQMLTMFDEERVLEQVIELTATALGAVRATLMVRPEEDAEWKHLFVRRLLSRAELASLPQQKSLHMAREVLDKGLAGWVVRHKEGALVLDSQTDSRWYTFPDAISSSRSALCVPIMFENEVLALVTFVHDEPNHFTEHHLQLATIVANQATVAIRNAQLFDRMLQQQRQLEAVLHAMPDLLLVLSDSGNVLLTNEAAAHFLLPDEKPELIVGRPLSDFADHDSALQVVQSTIAQAHTPGQSWSFEVRSEQQRRDYLVSITEWEASAGSTMGYVVVMRDVTTLLDLNRFKDEMLRMASHDLRSPLALIVGYCSLIELDTPENSPVHEYLQVILRASDRMKGLLDALLRVEQIRQSPLELNEQVVFADLVTDALTNAQPLIHNKGQTVELDVRLDDVPGVTVNQLLIRESMENLINNASKYTPEGGHIIVRAYAEAGRLHFMVEDNGIGIPKEHLPRLFQNFYRVKQPGTEKVEGRGQGLSLVKTVIERHSGEVWVESEPGVGSRFGFWLPLP
jgi:two-component system phosphate regulon sensor histidine kinase PhoR